MHAHVYVPTHVCMYVGTTVSVYMCARVSSHTCTDACTHVCTHMYTGHPVKHITLGPGIISSTVEWTVVFADGKTQSYTTQQMYDNFGQRELECGMTVQVACVCE